MDTTPPAEERILRTALQRFAVEGLAAPLRAVAQDAGVSAGLIIHHFGSREQLLTACDRRALEVTRETKLEVMTGGTGVMLAQLAEVERYAPVVGYVLRRLQAGGPMARQLIDGFVADAAVYFAQGEANGVITPSRDPAARARALTEMALGALLLQLPAQREPLDLAQLPVWLRSHYDALALPMLELYTTPLLADSSLLDAYPASAPTDAAIVVRGLTKTFGATRALDGFDLTVPRGEVTGFLGPNGAGKSTTIRILLGLLRATSGRADVLGMDPWAQAVQIHHRLAYVPGDTNLWPNLTG